MRIAHPALLIIVGVTAAAAEPLPVQNPGFEETEGAAIGPAAPDWQTEGSPPGWHHWIGTVAREGNPVLTWETEGGRTDPRCVSLEGCEGVVCVIQSVPIEPGEHYIARAWVRAADPRSQSECGLLVRWQDPDGAWTGGRLTDRLPRSADPGEWHELQVVVQAPDDAGFLVLMLTADAQGPGDKCWFDDVSVTRLGPTDILVMPCTWMPPLLWPEGEPPETPHVKWATPWREGRLRALFILGSDHSLREPIELAQRMDLDYDYTFARNFEQSLYALNDRQIMQRLEEGYYDVAVVALNATADLTDALLERLGAEGGLVLISGPGVNPALSEQVTPAAAPDGHYTTLSRGALPVSDETDGHAVRTIDLAEGVPGRVVRIAYHERFWCLTPNHTYEDFLRWGADYQEGYLHTLMRAMLWAAGRAPAQGAVMTPTDDGARLTIPAELGRLSARVWVTDRLNRRAGEADFRPAAGAVDIPCPPEAASGPAMYAAILTDDDGRVVDFAACLAEAPRPARIIAVTPGQDWFDADGPVNVMVQTAGATPDMRVEAVLADAFGREIARATVPPAEEGATSLRLSMRDHLSAFNRVEARLLEGQEELDAASGHVLVPLSREEFLADFQVGTWACTWYHPAYLHDAMLDTMKRAAITSGLEGARAYLPSLAGGVWPVSIAYSRVPGFTRFEGPDTAREPCLSDPETRSRMAEIAEEIARAERAFRPLFAYLRDETSLVRDALDLDTCSSEHCRARYRESLQERYETVEELNAHWGTAYRSWDDLGFVDYRQARRDGNLAPWLMYRRFMDWVWADAVTWTAEHVRRGDPTQLSALANSFGLTPFAGRDYELLAQANQYTMEYPYEAWAAAPWHDHFEAVRSFSPDTVHHPWIGYRHVEEAFRYEPWWCALHGASGVSIYGTMSVFAGNNSWAQVFPTLQLTRRGRMYAEVVEPLKQGIGKALMTASRPQADIAMLWSQPSLYVAWGLTDAEGIGAARTTKGPYRQFFYSHRAFRQAVTSSGRQFDYVTEGQIAQGALERYRALVLPAAFAVGPDLCEQLHRFVEAGGRLIADMGAGLTNDVGFSYDGEGPLADLLGIRRQNAGLTYEQAAVQYLSPTGRAVSIEADGHERLAPVEGAIAYPDGSPAVVARTLGAGETIFLNFAAADPANLRAVFDGLPTLADLACADDQTTPREYEIVRLDRGAVQYLGVLRDYRERDGSPAVTMELPERRHVYDVRAGRYMGETDRVALQLEPGDTALLACLPYEVRGLAVAGPRAVAPGETCVLRVTVQADATVGDHVVRVEVTDPQGRIAEAYSRNLLTSVGEAEARVPFAPNDPVGTWTVGVRDIATGAAASWEVELTH